MKQHNKWKEYISTILTLIIIGFLAFIYSNQEKITHVSFTKENPLTQKNPVADKQTNTKTNPIIPVPATTTQPKIDPTSTCSNTTNNKADVRQMWVWADVATNNKQLLSIGTQTNIDFFNFVDSHKIQTAYVFLPAGLLNDKSKTNTIKTFLNTAKKNHCLDIEALDGDTDWIDVKKRRCFTCYTTTKNK